MKTEKYPRITKAFLLISLDNGGINRNRSEEQAYQDMNQFMSRYTDRRLKSWNKWLRSITHEQFEIVCMDEESERLELMSSAPEGLDNALNDYFEQVC